MEIAERGKKEGRRGEGKDNRAKKVINVLVNELLLLNFYFYNKLALIND